MSKPEKQVKFFVFSCSIQKKANGSLGTLMSSSVEVLNILFLQSTGSQPAQHKHLPSNQPSMK